METSLHVAEKPLSSIAPKLKSPRLRGFLTGDLDRSTGIVENLISAFFAAGAVAFLYLAALEFLPASLALILALSFAFGTLLWSLVSRALWQHSPSVFVNSLLVLLLVRDQSGRGARILTGVALALGFFIRPSNAAVVLIIGIYIVRLLRAGVGWVVAGGLPVTLGFVVLNLHMYGHVIAPYFLPVREGSTGLTLGPSVIQAVAANLISPARGLLVFMPFLLFLLVGSVWRVAMPPVFLRLRPWFCALIGLYMLLVATHDDWWGGFSYGPRYLSDALPFVMFLWAPVLLWMARIRWRQILVTTSLIAAFLIQFRGATSIQPHQWNATPVNVSDHTSRIWDWTDPPFLRGL